MERMPVASGKQKSGGKQWIEDFVSWNTNPRMKNVKRLFRGLALAQSSVDISLSEWNKFFICET
ncbi:hypothetical protein OESDEN_21121 [Oesophagostomum dentatum]|uniref:Uncharacterized protein n=1 Tax=Oesophagostomum dentatum TaxID=61180 RepID=A0A0B1S1M2_OESDE|nr:hypothetical protein OESDEN_21121 [Oesophagostomum dentatum]